MKSSRAADAPAGPARRPARWVIGLFAVTVSSLLVVALFCMDVLSSVRAYVEGESLWSKAQKDAVSSLMRYAETRDEEYWGHYLEAMSVCLGDRAAREELEKPQPDLAVARRGMLEGGNHPDDIAGMIRLFRWFRHVEFLDDAIRVWADGDRLLAELKNAADELHGLVLSGSSAGPRQSLAAHIERLDHRLTPLEVRFSDTLGRASRKTQALLTVALLAIGALLIGLSIAFARRMAQHADRYERGLREANEHLEERVAERTRELTKSEAQFRLLIEGVEDYAILMLDPQGRVITWNEGARRVKGYDRSEIIGQPMERFYCAEDVALGRPGQLLERAATQGRCWDQGWQTRKDGTRFFADMTLTAMRGAGGELVGFARITRDVTARRQAERRIQGQLEALTLLDHVTRSIGERWDLKSIFQIVVRTLEESMPLDFGCICLRNAAANDLTVTCVGAKSKMLAYELAMDENASIEIDEDGLSRCIQGQLVYEANIGETRFPFPARLARGGMSSVVLAPLRSESRVFGVVVAARRQVQGFSSVDCEFLRQLSEHVALAAHQAQLYGALQQAYDDLCKSQQVTVQQERLRALGQMASGIAHDINNALSPVSLYTESLLETERNLSERARAYLEITQRAVDDVAQTVARLREFYRPREEQLELEPVQMNTLVQQVIDLTRARWSDMPQSRGIVIEPVTELRPDLPKIMGVESDIREALTNLVFNAVDAMPEGGTLTLRTRLAGSGPDQSVAIEVADTGVGMDEEVRRRCLEPFFTTKGERGTGMGLAMVFGVAQRHSCELEIESAPGAGTTVRLMFAVPVAVLQDPLRPARPLEAPSRLRLLLVDDDPVLLVSLHDALEIDRHAIVKVTSGEEAIAVFRRSLDRGELFNAVVTDLGMPNMDGRRVAAAVKETSPATPVILLTGWGERLIAEGDMPPGVDRILSKPPKLRELREALAQLCRHPTVEPIA